MPGLSLPCFVIRKYRNGSFVVVGKLHSFLFVTVDKFTQCLKFGLKEETLEFCLYMALLVGAGTLFCRSSWDLLAPLFCCSSPRWSPAVNHWPHSTESRSFFPRKLRPGVGITVSG